MGQSQRWILMEGTCGGRRPKMMMMMMMEGTCRRKELKMMVQEENDEFRWKSIVCDG
uniref:Uncharacterized protein n=1 Tax=Octopus bimaculoides TaxID=37653 RepID=A0A0L8I2Y6_OCTBM